MVTAPDYKLRPRERLHIALEDLDLSFTRAEVAAVIEGWRRGDHVADIADRIRRDPDEVAVLLIDLARCGRIARRQGGVFGG